MNAGHGRSESRVTGTQTRGLEHRTARPGDGCETSVSGGWPTYSGSGRQQVGSTDPLAGLTHTTQLNKCRTHWCSMSPTDGTTVADVMSTPLETISEDATVTEAAQRMRDNDISALVVLTTPRSIVSSTDVLDAVAQGRETSNLRVSDVMTTDVETAAPDLYMEEAAAMMTTYGIKHLPVVDDDYVGMVSSTDVMANLS